ncbi:MAG: hypothetical protein WC314_07375 [Vulcanimicrobiota bacterium]
MNGFDLQAFLAEQRSEGVQDSEGSFTVAREKALTKMAHYALPDPYSWALKIVQAANSWEADLLEIAQSRIATSFFFRPKNEEDLPTDEEIVSVLQSGKLEGSIGLLGMALCALVQQAKLSFVLAVRRGPDTQKPIYAGDDTSALDQETREKWTAMSRPGIRLTVSHFRGDESFLGRYTPTVLGVPRRDIEIVRILEEQAFASPTAITVDRRLLTSVRCSKLGMFEAIYRPFMSGRFQEDRVEATIHSPLPERQHFSSIRLAPPQRGPHFLVCSLEWRVQRALATGMGPFAGLPAPPRHRVYWVRHGVVVEKKSVLNTSSGTVLSLFLPADSYRSDLTGLSVELPEKEKGVVVDLVVQAASSLINEGANYLATIQTFGGEDSREWSFEPQPTGSITAAGFSLATESLGTLAEYARSMRDRALEALNEMVQFPGTRKKLLDNWRVFLGADFEAVQRDVEGFREARF